MKNLTRMFLITLCLVLTNTIAVANSDYLRLPSSGTDDPRSSALVHYANSYMTATNKNTLDVSMLSSTDLPDYDEAESYAWHFGSFSISPYWFYALKIIILLVVLMWDDKESSKSKRK